MASEKDDSAGGTFLPILVKLTLVNALGVAAAFWTVLAGRNGLLMADGGPVGGDFVNLWTTARLVLEGKAAAIYDPAAFRAFQQTLVHADIGHRLWAYPPHSLLLAWPFGLFGYFGGLAIWSTAGLALLAWGARRFGFAWRECAVLILSPAALCCVYYGQTGNVAAGLLLVALASATGRETPSVAAAALLTIKPQAGFLLPLVWIGQRRWLAIAATAAATLALLGLSVVLFGLQPWRDYVMLTAPELSALERYGSGPFMVMIPSLFMALRLQGMDGDSALAIHAAFAAIVLLALVWRFVRTQDTRRRIAMVLVAASLITPYVHIYDLAILVVAALLLIRRPMPDRPGSLLAALATGILWLAPYLVYTLGNLGMPVMPLLLVVAFLIV